MAPFSAATAAVIFCQRAASWRVDADVDCLITLSLIARIYADDARYVMILFTRDDAYAKA